VDVGSHAGLVTREGELEGNHWGAEDEGRAFGKAWKAWRPRVEGLEVPAERVAVA